MARQRLAAVVYCLALLGGVETAPAQQAGSGPQPVPSAAEVRRIRGIIDKDQSWSGTVIITDDVTIQDATVTVNPGTTVEFAHAAPGSHPTLTVGTATSAAGELKVLSTAEQPITFRTRETTNAGHIVVNIRNSITYGPAHGNLPGGTSRPVSVPNDVTWRYVRFERLGFLRPQRASASKARLVEPAVAFNLLGGPHKLNLLDCAFTGCTRVEIRAGNGAEITAADNRFNEEAERSALQVLPGGEGWKSGTRANIRGNVLSAALSVEGLVALVAGNIVVGPGACLVVKEDGSAESRIIDNYIHNTTTEDEGRYCLNCENPAALIEGNIIRGGTMCVLNGSRRMSGNVFIGAARLSSRYVRDARTHQLVAALPQEATFERNLLLGPANSLLVPQPAASPPKGDGAKGPTIIRHNLFDGFGESSRAIHLNSAGRPSAPVAVMNNVVLRVPTLVYDEAGTDDTLTYADYNAAAPPLPRPFDRAAIAGIAMGKPGWAANDICFDDVAALRLAAAPQAPPADFNSELLAGKVSIAQMRKRLFDAYRPLANSPLIGAGRASSPSDTANDHRCTIGPNEAGK